MIRGRNAPSALASRRGEMLGIGAALAAALIWGCAIAATRAGVVGNAALTPADLALLRFLLPALVLAPTLRRAKLPGFMPALALVAGGGAPFVLIVATAMRLSPASEAGVLLPGAFPLWVALLARWTTGERIAPARVLGLMLIGAALAAIALPSLLQGGSFAALMLIGAAGLSAAHTLALRRSGLDPFASAGFIGAISVAATLPAMALHGGSAIASAPLPAVLLQALFQGGLSGLAAPVLFAAAIARLGPARASAFGGLTPAAAALFGLLLLGESPDATTLGALCLAGLGVGIASLSPALPRARPASA